MSPVEGAQRRILEAVLGGADDHYSIGRAAGLEPWEVNAVINAPEGEHPRHGRLPAGLLDRTPSSHPLHVYSGSTYALTAAGRAALEEQP